MKTIGLIGGMSWESSLEYYRIINEAVKERLGGHHSCDSLMYSVDFGPIKDLQHAGNWDQLTSIMIEAAQRLEKGGAELLVICTNTMHRMAPDIEKKVNLPLIHIGDTTATAIKEAGLKKVLLLGTRFTMEQEFYKGRLTEKHGLEVITPEGEDIETIHNIIYYELVLGKVVDSSREKYKSIIKKAAKQGAEGVILGCTEIPLLIKPNDSPIPVFDTTTIHAVKAVEEALK
jgi:aspartate racemase